MNKYEKEKELEAPEEGQAGAMNAPASSHSMPAPEAIPASPIMDEQGAFNPDWYSRFEDLKEYGTTLSKFRRPEALAKSYAYLERMKGYPGVENSKQMSAFRRSVGLPDTAEEYKLMRPESASEEVWNDGLASDLSKLAYEYGIPATAMDALASRYCEANEQHLQHYRKAEQQAVESAEAELQRSWGLDYEDNINAVHSVMQHLGQRAGVNLEELSQNPALKANADFARLMLEVAHLVEEPPMRRGQAVNHKDEAYRIAHDPTHPLHEAYMRTSHPQHRHANEQYDRYAFGNQSRR